jgi:hypothetical protein
LIREYLAGVRTTELKEPPEQRGLINPGKKQDIAGKCRLNEGIDDVARPALPVRDQVRNKKRLALAQVYFTIYSIL